MREENTMRAKVLRNGHDITASLSNSAFNWTRESGNAVSDAAWELSHAGMKSFALGADDLVNRVKISCRYTSTEDSYGSINSTLENGILNVNHSPSTADANDTFDVNENGELLVNRDAGVGAAYSRIHSPWSFTPCI